MAKFSGVEWAPHQFQYLIQTKEHQLLESDAKAYAISRSLHYGLFQVFEGIRFFVEKAGDDIQICFVNLEHNFQRFRRGILFSISPADRKYVPTADEFRAIFFDGFFRQPELRSFLQKMAETQAQGYFRPFTLDEVQSMGVTFPQEPGIRAAFCSYVSYLGEPFDGVVVPNLVRAVSSNGTGCLKLGSNYLLSVKAVQQAQEMVSTAHAALFLDDRPDRNLYERKITEWDSSCALFALRDGSVVKIPEGPMLLPSVTIQGICALAKERGIEVQERDITYGELVEWVQNDQLVTICSIGTAGILNRCSHLHLVDQDLKIIAKHTADSEHPLFKALGECRADYWKMYTGEKSLPEPLVLEKHIL